MDPQTNTLKRCRSPSSLPGWVEYDADVLDNVRRTKRFAVGISLSDHLTSTMTLGSDQSPMKSINNNRETISGADAMCISSVECSPMATPKELATMGAPGWTTPQRSTRPLSPAVSVMLAERSLTSPSDPQIDVQELRRVALRRVALMRGNSSSTPSGGGVYHSSSSSAAAVGIEETGSPMVLGEASHGDGASRRSRLARPQQRQQQQVEEVVEVVDGDKITRSKSHLRPRNPNR